jgi:hypothetical protein
MPANRFQNLCLQSMRCFAVCANSSSWYLVRKSVHLIEINPKQVGGFRVCCDHCAKKAPLRNKFRLHALVQAGKHVQRSSLV